MSDKDIKKEKRCIFVLILLAIIWTGFLIHNSVINSKEDDELKLIISNQNLIIKKQLEITTNEIEMFKEHRKILSKLPKE